MDLSRTAVIGEDVFYHKNGKKMQPNWWKSRLDYLLREQGMYLYVAPTLLEPATHKLGEIVFNEDHCTREIIPIPPKTVEEERAIIDAALSLTDGEMGRVVEDLIYLLQNKGVISKSELPGPAQNHITERENLRSQRP